MLQLRSVAVVYAVYVAVYVAVVAVVAVVVFAVALPAVALPVVPADQAAPDVAIDDVKDSGDAVVDTFGTAAAVEPAKVLAVSVAAVGMIQVKQARVVMMTALFEENPFSDFCLSSKLALSPVLLYFAELVLLE